MTDQTPQLSPTEEAEKKRLTAIAVMAGSLAPFSIPAPPLRGGWKQFVRQSTGMRLMFCAFAVLMTAFAGLLLWAVLTSNRSLFGYTLLGFMGFGVETCLLSLGSVLLTTLLRRK